MPPCIHANYGDGTIPLKKCPTCTCLMLRTDWICYYFQHSENIFLSVPPSRPFLLPCLLAYFVGRLRRFVHRQFLQPTVRQFGCPRAHHSVIRFWRANGFASLHYNRRCAPRATVLTILRSFPIPLRATFIC